MSIMERQTHKTNIVIKELYSIWSEIHGEKLQKRNILGHDILIHEIQWRSDQIVDVVV